MEELFISKALLVQLLRFAETRGVHTTHWEKKQGSVEVEVIPLLEAEKLYAHIEHKTGDREFGLHLGATGNMAALKIVGQLIQFSDTVETALEKAIEYLQLLTNAFNIHLKKGENTFRILFELDRRCPIDFPVAARHLMSSVMAFAYKEIRFLIGKNCLPLDAALQFRTDATDQYYRIFNTHLKFEAANNYLEFDKGILQQRIHYADYELLMVLEKVACERLMQLNDHRKTFRSKVKSMIYTQLEPALPSVSDVATLLNLSSRSLQRKLKEEGTSYSKITEEIRKELAVIYLKKDHSVKEVSYLLGYAESSSFINAFRKWFRTTPSAYREMM